MQCSSKNFLASQVFYGLTIAHPKWYEDKVIESSFRIAEKMMKRSKRKTIKSK